MLLVRLVLADFFLFLKNSRDNINSAVLGGSITDLFAKKVSIGHPDSNSNLFVERNCLKSVQKFTLFCDTTNIIGYLSARDQLPSNAHRVVTFTSVMFVSWEL